MTRGCGSISVGSLGAKIFRSRDEQLPKLRNEPNLPVARGGSAGDPRKNKLTEKGRVAQLAEQLTLNQ